MIKILSKISEHKIISTVIVIIVVFSSCFFYKISVGKEDAVKYALAMVEKGIITVSVSGSGQVSVSNQVDIKARTSGDILEIKAEKGQKIKEGDTLLRINNHDAQKAVRDAQLALDIDRTELAKLSDPADEIDILKAENAVNTAEINLEELLNSVDEFTLTRYQNNLDDAKRNFDNLKIDQKRECQDALDARQSAEENVDKAYEDAYDSIANIFLELPEITTELREILYGYEIADSDNSVPLYSMNATVFLNSVFGNDRNEMENFNNIAIDDYENFRLKFDQNLKNYKNTSRYSENEIINELLDEVLETIKAVSETVKSEINMIDFWIDCRSKNEQKIFSKVKEYQSDLKSQTSKTANYLATIFSARKSIEDSEKKLINARQSIIDFERDQPVEIVKAEWNIKEKEEELRKIIEGPKENEIESARILLEEKKETLKNLLAGADSLDLRSKKNSVQQKADILADAEEELANCSVRAPFDGIIADMSVKNGDSVSSGNILLTFISGQKIAEISLNEIDVARVKMGQKAIINFDAVENLNITGEVAEVDTMGNNSQGVVNYGIKIVFDLEDERVKPGMSLTVSIITDVKQDILMIPNSAVKTSGNNSYLEIPREEIATELLLSLNNGIVLKNSPQQQQIKIGISNDTYTEIINGVEEGEYIIVRTITSSINQTTKQTQGQSLFQMGGSGASGNFRMTR